MNLINRPYFVPLESYLSLIDKITSHYKQNQNVKSIYQLGSIKNPGISDLDILLILKNEAEKTDFKFKKLDKIEKYILTHSFFGCKENEHNQLNLFQFQSNYKHLAGDNLFLKNEEIGEEIKHQIALEYLLIFYISLTRQFANNTIKLRTFLLEAKAIEFDLKLLNINSGNLYQLTQDVIELRNAFFKIKISDKTLKELISNFYKELQNLLKSELEKTRLFSTKLNFNISKNMTLCNSQYLSIKKSGIFLPSYLNLEGNYFSKFNNKFGKIEFGVPMQLPKENSSIDVRFKLIERIQNSQKKNYPLLLPLSSKINFYR